ncbi:MAG: MgtC/SapB family protein, partial [Cyanobacteria bacterium J06588_4]
MDWTTFAIRLLVGFFLAVGIGIERQWLKTRAVLKTNVLVTLGSAMFVMLSIMTPGDSSPTRISAQIVSGVGFLGGGVILREGASVKGINTAATLWCAAAIGTLVGSGF